MALEAPPEASKSLIWLTSILLSVSSLRGEIPLCCTVRMERESLGSRTLECQGSSTKPSPLYCAFIHSSLKTSLKI